MDQINKNIKKMNKVVSIFTWLLFSVQLNLFVEINQLEQKESLKSIKLIKDVRAEFHSMDLCLKLELNKLCEEVTQNFYLIPMHSLHLLQIFLSHVFISPPHYQTKSSLYLFAHICAMCIDSFTGKWVLQFNDGFKWVEV